MENITADSIKNFILQNLDTALVLSVLIYIGKKLQVLSGIEKCLEKVKNNIKVIADTLIDNKNISFDHTKLQHYSPIRLSPDGEKFINTIGFDRVFEDHKQDFYDFINSESPKTDFDIQNQAIKAVSFLFEKDYFNTIKDYLYQHPEDRKDIGTVLGIYARDKYQEYKKECLKSEC